MTIRTVLPFGYKHIKEVPTAMAVSFITLWSLWAFLLLVLFLKSAFAHQAEAVFRRNYRTIRLNAFQFMGYMISDDFCF